MNKRCGMSWLADIVNETYLTVDNESRGYDPYNHTPDTMRRQTTTDRLFTARLLPALLRSQAW